MSVGSAKLILFLVSFISSYGFKDFFIIEFLDFIDTDYTKGI